MSDSQQALLRSAWLDAKDGSLSGREQAKAWAMREIWKGDGKPKHGMLQPGMADRRCSKQPDDEPHGADAFMDRRRDGPFLRGA